jgi:hypothetical protein
MGSVLNGTIPFGPFSLIRCYSSFSTSAMSLQMILEPHTGLPPSPVVFTQEQISCLEQAAIFLPEFSPNASTNTSGKRKVSAAFNVPSLSQIHIPRRCLRHPLSPVVSSPIISKHSTSQ